MKQKGKVVLLNKTFFTPRAERVLITSVCKDVYKDDSELERPSSVGFNGYQDGFGEYATHLPENYKFFTNQRSYGLSFLESNVKGPTYMQYPLWTELEYEIASGQYDVLCISAYTWSLSWAIETARMAKEKYGFKEVWLGGYAVMTDEPEINSVFDRLFWGYSESSLNEAIGQEGKEIEDIRHPDLTTEGYFLGKKTISGHVLSRRGCPNKCSYCADPVFQPGGEKSLSFEHVKKIIDLYHDKGIRSIYFSNQDTNLHEPIGKRLVDYMYKKGMHFGILTSFKSLSLEGKDGIIKLHEKGLNFILLGLESLNDTNLIKNERRIRYKEMIDTLKFLQNLKVIITSTYMICFEDDTPQTIREAKKKIMKDLGISVCLFNITMPLPGTPMYWDYKKRDLIFDWNWNRWNGNHLVWKHPTINPVQARELLAEMRSEVNSPEFNPNVSMIWNSRKSEMEKPVSIV